MTKIKKGFTLIELMVIIAMIGILTAITLVSAQSFREGARAKTALSLVNSMIAPMSECVDNNKTPSFVFDATTPLCNDSPSTWVNLSEVQWQWVTGTHTYSPFNGSFSFSATDNSDATGCITCSQFTCTIDKTADCS